MLILANFPVARACAWMKPVAVTRPFAKYFPLLSCRSAQVKCIGTLTLYFSSGYFEGEVFTDQNYKRVPVQGQWFYEHEASGIKVWEHARLP